MKVVLALSMLVASISSCQSSTVTTNYNSEVMEKNDLLQLVKTNKIDAVAKALSEGANVNIADGSKRSLLLIATNNEQTEMAKLLVKHGADVNQQADNLDSPFLYAGASGQTELVDLFIKNGARFDLYNRYNGTALIPACERGHVETVRLLVNTPNFPINHVNRLGWTGLMEAVILGDGSLKYQQIVQLLMDAGAKDIPDFDGVTALKHAEKRGYTAIVAILKK